MACVSIEGVALPAKLLGADEHVVIHTRTHVKAMILPALAFVLIAAAVGAGAALIPREARPSASSQSPCSVWCWPSF